MKFGKLNFAPVETHIELVAEPTKALIEELSLKDIQVSNIDANLADTAAFCEHYEIALDASANCVIVEAKRADKAWFAACIVLATTKADINNIVRRQLDARRISFAPMNLATSLTHMMYGGITPIGLPSDWPILIDERVNSTSQVIIGSGLRTSKLLIPGNLLSYLPNARVLYIAKG